MFWCNALVGVALACLALPTTGGQSIESNYPIQSPEGFTWLPRSAGSAFTIGVQVQPMNQPGKFRVLSAIKNGSGRPIRISVGNSDFRARPFYEFTSSADNWNSALIRIHLKPIAGDQPGYHVPVSRFIMLQPNQARLIDEAILELCDLLAPGTYTLRLVFPTEGHSGEEADSAPSWERTFVSPHVQIDVTSCDP